MTRVLLLQLPFFTLDSPSIALSLLKASLKEANIPCDLLYRNLDFGKQLGPELYSFIAGSVPVHSLYGDLLFAEELQQRRVDRDRVQELVHPPGAPGRMELPESLIEVFPELVQQSRAFLDETMEVIDWSAYQLVGLSTMFTIAPSLALAKRISALPDAPRIVLGGSYCEDVMGQAIAEEFPWIDFVCRGEGERLIVELARHLDAPESRPLAQIPGLLWRDTTNTLRCNDSAEYRGKATLIALGQKPRPAPGEYALDALAKPKYEDWMAQYERVAVMAPERRRLPIQTSRGCWYGAKHHCVFCGLNDATIAYRRKSPARALEEFRELFGQGIKMVHAVDDIMDFKYLKTLLPALERENPGVEIFYEIKANLSWEEVKLLRESGVVWIQPGIESLSTPLLRLMDKGTTALMNVRLLRYAAEHQVGVAWNLLYGFPNEEPAVFEQMAALLPAISHLQPPSVNCTQIRLHRFSPLFVNHETMGLHNLAPTPSHRELYPFPEDSVHRLAYYFDHDYADGRDPNSYIHALAAAVRAWHEEVGQATFISLARGDKTLLLDTRRVATTARATLEGTERQLFGLCEHGASKRELSRGMDLPASELDALLARFMERCWILELDGKYLSLAVPMTRAAQSWAAMPLPLVERSLRDSCQALMRRISRGGRSELPPAAFERIRANPSAPHEDQSPCGSPE